MTQAKYLTVQDRAEEVGFEDLPTGRQNHLHLVVAAHSAGLVEVYRTQLLHTRYITFGKKVILVLIIPIYFQLNPSYYICISCVPKIILVKDDRHTCYGRFLPANCFQDKSDKAKPAGPSGEEHTLLVGSSLPQHLPC